MDWEAVAKQRRAPDSLLAYMRRLVDAYRDCPELAWGSYTVLDPGPDARPVFAHSCTAEGATVVALHNFADREVTASITGMSGRSLVDVLEPTAKAVPVRKGRIEVTLPRYGNRWLRMG
jgi:hypothetical protein